MSYSTKPFACLASTYHNMVRCILLNNGNTYVCSAVRKDARSRIILNSIWWILEVVPAVIDPLPLLVPEW